MALLTVSRLIISGCEKKCREIFVGVVVVMIHFVYYYGTALVTMVLHKNDTELYRYVEKSM